MKKALMFVLIALLISSFVSQMSIRAEVYEPRKVENVEMNTQDELGSIGGSNTESEQGELCHDRETVADLTQAIGPMAVPPTEWSRPYGGADTDRAWSVLQTSDGGYLIVGDTYSYGSGSYDFWIVKTDSSGNQQWAKPYGGSASEGARSAARTYDGGYIVAGYIDPPGPDPADVWIVKIDAMGNKQWDLQWGGSNRDMAYSVIQSSDGRYIVAGYTMSFGAGNEDAFLLKIDPVLGTSFVFYGGTDSDVARCVLQNCDGGFAIAGYTKSYGSGSYDFWLIKTDYAGNMLWQKTHGNTGSDMAYSIAQTCEGGYILAGDTDYYTAGSCDFWVVKTNSVGNLAWSQKFGGTGFDSASSVVQTCDGGYLIAGETTSFGAVLEDFWVVKTDSSLSEQWNQRYGGSGSDSAYSALQASDGGYAIAGPTSSFGAGSNDFWLVKLGNEYPMADLRILPKLQLKDTRMLCLDGCSLSGVHGWDVPHRAENWQQCVHDNMYCTRASISIINSYYGGRLSQDRISYYYFEQLHRDGKPGPEGDLGHNIGMPADEALSWALNGAVGNHYSEKPDFTLIRQWIDAGRPILRYTASGVGHFTVIDGYAIVGSDNRVHLLDPWDGSGSFVSYSALTVDGAWWTPAGATARSDEDWNGNGIPDTIEDYDHDGVCDFDEIYRFNTNPQSLDTDGDSVPDKAEIVGYTFLTDGSFDVTDLRKPDPDNDGLRAEMDWDSDNGGVRDGLEDKNGNGFFEPLLGETDPLDPSDDPNSVHLESSQDTGATVNLGSIKFAGSSYSLPDDITKTAGTYPIEYSAVSGYQFYQWETTSGVSVADPNAWSTTATVSGSGTLRAKYRAVYVVHLESSQDAGGSVNLGGIRFDGSTYSLPSDVTKPAGTYSIEYNNASGYVFYQWETTLGVSVTNPNLCSTTATVSGSGTSRAMYKEGVFRVHNLDTGLDYSTIQAALDAPETLNGHTVFVENGTYHENVIVRKSITLKGEDKSATVIDGEGSTVINVQANNVKIAGFTMQNGWSGILIDGFNGTEISENTISFNVGTGIGDGIYIVRSHFNIIRNNTISYNTEDGLTLAPNTTDSSVSGNNIFSNGGAGVYMHDLADRNTIVGNNISLNGPNGLFMGNVFANLVVQNNIEQNEDGIRLWGSSYNTISGNIISHNSRFSILLYSSSNNSVSGNNIANNYYGIYLYSSSNNTVSGNNIINNDYGIRLESSSNNNIVSGNNITANNYRGICVVSSSNNSLSENNMTANNYYGMWFYSSSSNSVSENDIANNIYGIYLYSSSNNTVSGNNITDNSCGIILYSSSNNSISHNYFRSTVMQIYSSESTNIWDYGYPSGGNYWSDYIGSDVYSGTYQNEAGSDGIGDTPYAIDASNQDNYPLTRPYVPFENQIICIRADGSVDPSGAPIWRQGDFYTLTNNVTSAADGILIERDNMKLDGAGYTVTGSGSGNGITLEGRSNVTVRKMTIRNFYSGIVLDASSNNTLSGNNVANNEVGIGLDYSSSNSISGNNITANNMHGIYLHSSSNNAIDENSILGNWYSGICLSSSSNNSIFRNNATGNLEGVYLYQSSDNKISDNTITANIRTGIYMEDSCYSNLILQNNITDNDHGILDGSFRPQGGCLFNNITANLIAGNGVAISLLGHSSISYNDVVQNRGDGINIGNSGGASGSSTNVFNNHVENNGGDGMHFSGSTGVSVTNNDIVSNGNGIVFSAFWYYGDFIPSRNIVSGNNIVGNAGDGIRFVGSNNSTISQNNIKVNGANGIYFDRYFGDVGDYTYCLNNSVYENNIEQNVGYGIRLAEPLTDHGGYPRTNNRFYHNNFVDNQAGATYTPYWEASGIDFWDNGYPSGGNYWSDYAGLDLYNGAYQNESGSDGIGDVPYSIDASNIDHYPLMIPWPTSLAIELISPQNNTYYSSSIPICFTLTKPASWVGYSLDNQQNITISSNTIIAVSDGPHEIVIYANDSLGAMASSEIVHFTVASSLHDPYQTSFIGLANYPVGDFAEGNGNLYATSSNLIYVYDGESWNVIQAPTHTISLMSREGRLLVAGKGGLYVFNGTTFTQVVNGPAYCKMLGTYNNTIYAATYLDKPPKLYYCDGSVENSADWHVDTGFSAMLNFSGPFGSIDSFAVYDDVMYVGSGGNLYSFNGTDWSVAASYDDVYAFLDMKVYDGKLYLATRDQGWRKPYYQGGTGFSGRVIEYDGENWTTVLDHDYWIYSLEEYDGKLYAGTANKILTYNGTDWETSFNATEGAFYAISMITYDGKVYAGMGNGYIFADPAPAKANPETIVVPEFSSTAILAVFMTLTMLAVALTRKNRSKRFD